MTVAIGLSGAGPESLKLWDVRKMRPGRVLKGHTDDLRSVAFSHHGKLLASGSFDMTTRLWDLRGGKLLWVSESLPVWSVAFSPDDRTLACGVGYIRNNAPTTAIRLLDVRTGKLKKTLFAHRDGVKAVHFSPDGRLLASGGAEGTVKLWQARTGTLLKTLPQTPVTVYSLEFSPDGSKLACASHREVKVWSIPSGKLLRVLKGHSDTVTSVAFSPDGTILASGSDDTTVRTWSVRTGEPLRVLPATLDPPRPSPISRVKAVGFSPDGIFLAAGTSDHLVVLWKHSEWQPARTARATPVSQRLQLVVDGKPMGPISTVLVGRQLLVPFRAIMETLGWKVQYEPERRANGKIVARDAVDAVAPFRNPDSGSASGIRDPFTIAIRIRQGMTYRVVRTVSRVLEELRIEPPPQALHGTAYVPLPFLRDQLEYYGAASMRLDWNKRELHLASSER